MKDLIKVLNATSSLIDDLNKFHKTLNGGQLAEARDKLANYFFFLNEQKADLQLKADTKWLELRKDYKSDTQTDKALSITEEGKNFNRVNFVLKAIEKKMSTLRSRMADLAKEEPFN